MAIWRSKLGGEFLKEEIQRLDAEHHKVLKALRSQKGNDHCAECGAKETMWASVNLGVFVCVQCADVHRGLGTHISKVKGCTGTYLWGPDEIARMQSLGNRAWGEPRGTPSTGKEEMLRLCREKYENGQPLMSQQGSDNNVNHAKHSTNAKHEKQRADNAHTKMASPAGPGQRVSVSVPDPAPVQLQPAAGVHVSAVAEESSLDDFLNDCLKPTHVPVLRTAPSLTQAPAPYLAHQSPFMVPVKPTPVARRCAQDFDFDAFFDECLGSEAAK